MFEFAIKKTLDCYIDEPITPSEYARIKRRLSIKDSVDLLALGFSISLVVVSALQLMSEFASSVDYLWISTAKALAFNSTLTLLVGVLGCFTIVVVAIAQCMKGLNCALIDDIRYEKEKEFREVERLYLCDTELTHNLARSKQAQVLFHNIQKSGRPFMMFEVNILFKLGAVGASSNTNHR